MVKHEHNFISTGDDSSNACHYIFSVKGEIMSILIKGMTMPKSCDECRIMQFEDTNCALELYCGCPIVFKAHPQGVDQRPDYCPLIEIPPHGRLIDADAPMRFKIMIDGGTNMCVADIYAHTVIEAEGDGDE